MKSVTMALGAAIALHGAALAQTVENGGFELPAIEQGNWKENLPGYGWIFNSSSGIANGVSAWGKTGHGGSQQYGFIQSAGDGIGMICTKVSGLVPGKRYIVTFWMARRDSPIPGLGDANFGVPIKLQADNDVLVPFTAPPADGTWRVCHSRSFVATTKGISLIFLAQTCLKDQAALIDDVSIRQVSRRVYSVRKHAGAE